MDNKYNKLIIILLVIFGVIFTIIGATFAYFSASASSSGNAINGSSYVFNMNLDVSPVRTGNLIPVADNLISTSLAGNYKCEDQRDYGLCSLYRLRFTNNGNAESLVGYLQTISTTYRTSNLRYRLYDSNYTPVSDIRTVSITPNDTNYFKTGSNNVDLTIPANGTKDYYLVIWIHDVDKNQLEDQNKLYTGRIVFTAKNGDRITSDFSTGDSIKVTFDANGGELYDNLVYGLEDKAETSSIRMSYSISNGIVTVTANNDDGCGYTTGRVNLEAGKTYRFSAESDGAWCNGGNSDTVEAYLMLNGQTNTYYTMQAGNLNNNGYYEFTPTVSGTYWLRLDVNKNGETHQFWNIIIKEKNTEPKIVTVGSTYGDLPTPTREGYTFKGWNGRNYYDVNDRIRSNVNDANINKIDDDYIKFTTNSSQQYYNYFTHNLDLKEDTGYTLILEVQRASISGTFYITSSNPPTVAQFNSRRIAPLSDNSVYVSHARTNTGVNLNLGLRTFYTSEPNFQDNEEMIFRISVLDVDDTITSDNFEYEPYYITSNTTVVQNKNHTLKAIWEPAS